MPVAAPAAKLRAERREADIRSVSGSTCAIPGGTPTRPGGKIAQMSEFKPKSTRHEESWNCVLPKYISATTALSKITKVSVNYH